MSQGSVGVLPIAVVFAAGAAVVVAAASAAVLVAYAANQTAEGALRVVGRKGAALEAEGAAQCEADREALRWQATAADAVGLNARLRMAAGQAARLGAPVDLPPPLDLGGRSRSEVAAWAARAEQRLAAAQQHLDAADTGARRRQLMATLPVADAARPDTARALAAYQATLRASRVVHQPPPDVDDEVTAILARVDPDATTDEHDAVLRTALLARTQQDALDADAYLTALSRLVDVEITAKVAARRQAATWLQALELPAVTAALAGPDPRPPFSGTAARLLSVVHGTAELTEALRDEGRRAAAWAAEVTRREFLRDRLRQRLTAAGYDVASESESARGTRLTATRADWNGEHSARLFVTRDGAVTGRLARHRPETGDEAHARDHDRCGELHTLLHGLAATTSGVTVRVEADQPPVLAYDEGAVPSMRPAHENRYRTRG